VRDVLAFLAPQPAITVQFGRHTSLNVSIKNRDREPKARVGSFSEEKF